MCHQLIKFLLRVIDITQERNRWTHCIYLDLRKALGRILLKRLLWKLEHIGGLKGAIMNWKEDYLKGREMRNGKG